MYKFHYKLRDPVSPELQARFDKGHDIGKLAQNLFPGGLDVSPPSVFQYLLSVKKTQEMIEKGWKVIYEAAFQHNDVLVALDILVNKNGKWYGYEVKSSFAISETYMQDAALQYHIITAGGLALNDFRFIYLDKAYQATGEPDISMMFKEESVIDICKEMEVGVIEKIEKAKEVILSKMMPDVAVGGHCDKPYICDFKGTCWKGARV